MYYYIKAKKSSYKDNSQNVFHVLFINDKEIAFFEGEFANHINLYQNGFCVMIIV